MLDVSTLAEEHDLALRPDFRDFLEAFPSGVRRFPLPAWAKAKRARAPINDARWAEDIAEIHGIAALDKLYGKADKDGECHFWNLRFLPHAYVVARSMEGDPIVQVARGRHAGKILRIDHESYHGFLEHLCALIPSASEAEFLAETARNWKKLGVTIPKLGTDAFVGFLLHGDFDAAELLASSFAEFYGELGRIRGAHEVASSAGRGAPAASSKAAAPLALPKLRVVHRGRGSAWNPELIAACVDGSSAYFAGSRNGKTALLRTTDGKNFAKLACPHPDVLDVEASGSQLWVCGGKQLVAHSADGGRSWKKQTLDLFRNYLWGIAADAQKRLWVLGDDDGKLATSVNSGKSFTMIAPSATVQGAGRLQTSRHGVLVPSGNTLRLGRSGKVHATTLRARGVRAAMATQAGTILVADAAGSVQRSTDGGKTWTKARIFKGPVEPDQLTCLAQSERGWILVAGTMWFVAISFDDGQTFRGIEHDQEMLMFGSAVPLAGGVLLGGSDGMVAMVD